MPGADGVFRQQDVAGVQQEVLAVAGLEIERPGERDHQLADRRGVPGERATRGRLLEGDGDDVDLAAQPIAALARLELDEPFLEMRIVVVAGP
jgi:hypothetical protein